MQSDAGKKSKAMKNKSEDIIQFWIGEGERGIVFQKKKNFLEKEK